MGFVMGFQVFGYEKIAKAFCYELLVAERKRG
jgi:hypothetical protein